MKVILPLHNHKTAPGNDRLLGAGMFKPGPVLLGCLGREGKAGADVSWTRVAGPLH